MEVKEVNVGGCSRVVAGGGAEEGGVEPIRRSGSFRQGLLLLLWLVSEAVKRREMVLGDVVMMKRHKGFIVKRSLDDYDDDGHDQVLCTASFRAG